MRLDQITSLAFDHLFKRLLWRALAVALLGLFGLLALYHFTVAGTLALEAHFTLLQARLIVAGAYLAAVLITLAVLFATRSKPLLKSDAADPSGMMSAPRNMQIAMLIEAAMLGYSLARKGGDQT